MLQSIKEKMSKDGFAVLDNLYTEEEADDIIHTILTADTSGPAFRKTNELFAVRQFLMAVPGAAPLVLNNKLKTLITGLYGDDYFIVKSVYFDKPPQSNWFVSRHQDLTISVDKKIPLEGYGPWTVKQDQYAVQPPPAILENIFTIRIHLDDTDGYNGALKVIPGSHVKGICRPETIAPSADTEIVCNVKKGGIMVMKPLLLHSSGRTTGNRQRRVIHIEFSNRELPAGIKWAEQMHLTDPLTPNK